MAVTETKEADQDRVLADDVIQAWRKLDRPCGPHTSRSVAEHAYLLFNRWDANPLAAELDNRFPEWTRDRVTVPDRCFEHRAEYAPCLLELPEELTDPTLDRHTRPVLDWFVSCLALAAQQVRGRTARQDFCGVVISPAPARTIARHWVGLGDQRPPYQDERVLFRYHDARVMQRVWPTLSAVQQSLWLGPVTHWWSLRQPWGPFNAAPEPAVWFYANAPTLAHDARRGVSLSALFDEPQWFICGASPNANLIWRGYADNNIAAEMQPDADDMLRMLADGDRLGLRGHDLEDYVWVTWQHAPNEGPPHAMDWSLPHLADMLKRIEAQRRKQPDARFSTLLNQIIQSKG